MFYTDEAVNELFYYSKGIIDNFDQNKSKSNDFLPEQYLMFAGMVSYYGFEYIDVICDVFRKSGFVKDSRTVDEFLGKKRSNKYYTPAFCQIDVASLVSKYFVRKNIYHLNCPNQAYEAFFEELLHEVNHCVNSTVSPICKRNSHPVYRSGVSVFSIQEGYQEALYLEEAFNTLQTAEIMNHVLAFKQYYIEDASMNAILQRFSQKSTNRFGRGYSNITPKVYPLYFHPEFYRLLKEGRISGNLKEIRNHFDQRVGEGSFLELASSIDGVWNKHSIIQAGKTYRLVNKYVRR